MVQKMKQNQKQNQKFNPKLIFLGSLLMLITVAFIFASGCVTDDINSDMSEVIASEINKLGDDVVTVPVPVPGGIVQPVTEYAYTAPSEQMGYH